MDKILLQKEIARLNLIIKGQAKNIKDLQRQLNIAKVKLGEAS